VTEFMTTPSGNCIVMSPPSALTVHVNGAAALIFNPDGTVTTSPNLKPDEAAKAVLDALERMAGQRAAEFIPCDHVRTFRKTITTNHGIVFVCELCSHHWFRTYAHINAVEPAS
jgi:hypothetical protein